MVRSFDTSPLGTLRKVSQYVASTAIWCRPSILLRLAGRRKDSLEIWRSDLTAEMVGGASITLFGNEYVSETYLTSIHAMTRQEPLGEDSAWRVFVCFSYLTSPVQYVTCPLRYMFQRKVIAESMVRRSAMSWLWVRSERAGYCTHPFPCAACKARL